MLRAAPRPGPTPAFLALGRLDGTSILSLFAVALMVVPNRQVIGPLGGAGSPAGVVGLVCLFWWVGDQVRRPQATDLGFQPVRAALLGFGFAIGASYVAATIRPIDATELSTATLGAVLLAGWAGVLLVAHDGIATMDRLLTLARRLVALGGGMAALGIIQFVTGQALVDRVVIPGLTANHGVGGLMVREGFSRPAATASHPIEYGAVVAMLLPVALALAMADRQRSAFRRWLPVGLMLACIPLSISRSALLAAAVGTALVVGTWPPFQRRLAVLGLMAASVVVYVAVPGMLGSLLGLFARIGSDTSALSRTGSYEIAVDFVARAPVFGRGFSTFLPEYRILDNQYLGLAVETGLVGLTAFVTLLVAGLLAARRAKSAAADRLTAQLATGLIGAVAAGAVTLALFDGLSFAMMAGVLFLVLGLCGASRRLLVDGAPLVPPRSRDSDPTVRTSDTYRPRSE